MFDDADDFSDALELGSQLDSDESRRQSGKATNKRDNLELAIVGVAIAVVIIIAVIAMVR